MSWKIFAEGRFYTKMFNFRILIPRNPSFAHVAAVKPPQASFSFTESRQRFITAQAVGDGDSETKATSPLQVSFGGQRTSPPLRDRVQKSILQACGTACGPRGTG